MGLSLTGFFHLASYSLVSPMLSQKEEVPSFFLLHTIPLCRCTELFNPLIYHGHLGCFQHLAIINNAAVNIGVHRFFWIGVSGFLGYNPSSRIAGSKGCSVFSFLRKSILFSTVAAPVCIPTNSVLGFPFLHILASICCLLFVNDGQSGWCEVVSHSGFNLHLSDV